ncbi:MAG: hypothetical protein WDZ49_16845 [Litorilinea sp.]
MNAADPLFELGRHTLHTLRDELAHHQIPVAPDLEVRRGTNALSYYNMQDGQIYLSTPNPQAARGKFELLLYRSVTRLESNTQVYRLLELLIPWLIAHEIGHHLRHRAGRLGADIWHEEYIANLVAGALIKPRLSAAQKSELVALLSQALGNLDTGLNGHHSTSSSSPSQSTEPTGPTGPRPRQQAEERPPSGDPLGYIARHMRWLSEDLVTPDTPPLARVARQYLRPQPGQPTIAQSDRNQIEGGEVKPS